MAESYRREKRCLGKGAKPTVFFVAGIFALCAQDLSHFFTFSPYPVFSFSSFFSFFSIPRPLCHPPSPLGRHPLPCPPSPSSSPSNDYRARLRACSGRDGASSSGGLLLRPMLDPLLDRPFCHEIFTNIQDGGIILPALRRKSTSHPRSPGPFFARKHFHRSRFTDSALSSADFLRQRHSPSPPPAASPTVPFPSFLRPVCRQLLRAFGHFRLDHGEALRRNSLSWDRSGDASRLSAVPSSRPRRVIWS